MKLFKKLVPKSFSFSEDDWNKIAKQDFDNAKLVSDFIAIIIRSFLIFSAAKFLITLYANQTEHIILRYAYGVSAINLFCVYAYLMFCVFGSITAYNNRYIGRSNNLLLKFLNLLFGLVSTVSLGLSMSALSDALPSEFLLNVK